MSSTPYDENKSGEHGIVIKTHHPNEDPNLVDGNTRVFTGTSNRISLTKAGTVRHLHNGMQGFWHQSFQYFYFLGMAFSGLSIKVKVWCSGLFSG